MPIQLRLFLTILLLGLSLTLPFLGYWTWAVLSLIIGLLGLLTYFKNEKLLIALYFMHKQKIDKAKRWLYRIKPQRELKKTQLAYYHLVMGMMDSSVNLPQAERNFKKALSLGLKSKQDLAMAKLGLAGGAMARRNKREATNLISEAKKLDKNKLLAEQIRMMKEQLKRL